MFKPNLHAAHAACEEGEFTYDGTVKETEEQKDPPDRRHTSCHSRRRQQDVSLRQAGQRQHRLVLDQEV